MESIVFRYRARELTSGETFEKLSRFPILQFSNFLKKMRPKIRRLLSKIKKNNMQNNRIFASSEADFEVITRKVDPSALCGRNLQDFHASCNIVCCLPVPAVKVIFHNRRKPCPVCIIMQVAEAEILFNNIPNFG